jgi:hypothetical protein
MVLALHVCRSITNLSYFISGSLIPSFSLVAFFNLYVNCFRLVAIEDPLSMSLTVET